MALAQYTDTFWFPTGALAANIAARVFPKASSALATLWADAAGTIPLANPTTTTGAGVLSFWAESGEYWVHLDSETFGVTVGMSQEQADLSTGIASGGEINASAVPSSVDITAVDGYIVNYLAGTQTEPVITRVKTAAQTVALDAAALLRATTWWLLDSTGAVIQQATKPDAVQQRTHIMLGVTAQAGGVVIVDQSLPVILPGQANQLVDLMESLGAFNISGNLIAASGANLMIDHSSGTVFSRAFGHFISGVLTNSPHIVTTQAQSPADFIRITRSTTTAPALTNLIDVANYDVGGVVTAIGGGTNRSSVHRVYLFPNNDPQRQLIVQYGQTAYATLDEAVAAIGTEAFVENPSFIQGGGALLAFIAARHTATNLSDTTQAVIVQAGKFGLGPSGQASLVGFAMLSGAAFTGAVSVNDANLSVLDTGVKGYRFRQDGSALDLEGSGADLLLSNWSGTSFNGTQYSHSRYSSGALAQQQAGLVEFVDALYGTVRHTLNGGANTAGFFGAAPVSRPVVTGSRGANAALTSLLTGLDSLGLVDDQTTA
jgi:hypothetical protein